MEADPGGDRTSAATERILVSTTFSPRVELVVQRKPGERTAKR